jgi:TrmH family RNA methyltransferase
VIITSSSNERLKHARRVREGRESGLIFVEGLRLVEECLRSGLPIETCFHTPGVTERMAQAVEALKQQGVSCIPVEPRVLAALSDTVSTQGLILIAHRPQLHNENAFHRGAPLLVGLDRVQDPGNVGTLIRTAEAAGATGLLLRKGCADPFSPKSLRSAMGSAFRLPIVDAGVAALAGVKVVAAAGAGEVSHYEYDWRQPTLLWLGNEGAGLSERIMAEADVRVRIPLQAGVESLNVAAAGAAILFEALRQRST